MMLKEMSLETFMEAVAGREAVPGGGSVSALAGALSAALAAMVAGLTKQKKDFETVADQMAALEIQANQLQRQLTAAVDHDADSYRQVLEAFRRPKSTDEEKADRRHAIEAAYRQAIDVPLEVARLCDRVMALATQAIRNCSPVMITDAGVALIMARSAALGALMNVRINLSGIDDPPAVAAWTAEVQRIKKKVLGREAATIGMLPL